MMAQTAEELRCSFCLRLEHEAAKIIAGPGSYICDDCVTACVGILSETPAVDDDAQLPSWQSMTEEQVLDRLPRIAAVAAQVEGALARWVHEARRRGASWASIGGALEMSRQSAWERFASAG